MIPATVELEPHTRGDRWQGIATIGPVTATDGAGGEPAPIGGTLVAARLQFRRDGELGHTLSTAPAFGEGTIAIVDAATWELSIPEQELPLHAGIWRWDMEFTDSGSPLPRTLYQGTLEVRPDVTR